MRAFRRTQVPLGRVIVRDAHGKDLAVLHVSHDRRNDPPWPAARGRDRTVSDDTELTVTEERCVSR